MEFFLRLFRPLTPKDIIEKQLAQSRMQLLSAESDREYADAQVRLLIARIDRLETHNENTP